MYRNLLTDGFIDREPVDSWAIIVDRDAEYVAVRSGQQAVMTRGCLLPEIAACESAGDVADVVREWMSKHPTAAAADRRRVEACHQANEDVRRDHLATDEAIRRRIAQHKEDCLIGIADRQSDSEVAAGVTVDEVADARASMWPDEQCV